MKIMNVEQNIRCICSSDVCRGGVRYGKDRVRPYSCPHPMYKFCTLTPYCKFVILNYNCPILYGNGKKFLYPIG